MIGELFGLDFHHTTTNRNNNNNFKSSVVAERRDLVGEETECHSSFHSVVSARSDRVCLLRLIFNHKYSIIMNKNPI